MMDNLGNTLVKAAAINFLLQWGLFLLSVCLRTNKFWFMAGSSFVLLAAQSLINTGSFFPRQLIQTGLVYTWAFRLGLFLMLRTWKLRRDSRFDCVKNNHKLFFFYWTMQGVWVFLTLLPTLILNSKKEDIELCTRDYVGWVIWVGGMLLEVIADYQKYTFRSNPANRDKWISHGLWSVVRHPNYLGEILLWIGLFISASSTFEGREYFSVISPLYVAFLLTKVSGVPLLEQQNMKRWKDNPKFLSYVQKTPKIIPFLW